MLSIPPGDCDGSETMLRNTEVGGIENGGVETVSSSVCWLMRRSPIFDLLSCAHWSFEESNHIFQKNRFWQKGSVIFSIPRDRVGTGIGHAHASARCHWAALLKGWHGGPPTRRSSSRLRSPTSLGLQLFCGEVDVRWLQ